jgi:type IX secretion system PorP/SprF family membrane protein
MKLKLTYCFAMVLFLILSQTTRAQQLPLFSQYSFNGFLINPAYAGLSGIPTMNLTAREQWMGLPNAPKTHLVCFQTRFVRQSFVKKSAAARRKMIRKNTTGKVGLGGFIYNDKNGIINRTGGQITYAYHLKLDKATYLSMATSFSMFQFSIPRDLIKTEYDHDLYIDNHALNMWIPDMNVGVVYSTPTYYAGISADQLLQAYLKLGKSIDDSYRLYRQYNLTGGYRYEVDRQTALEGSILLKTTNQLASQLDISGRVYYDNYWVGLSYRTGGAAIITMGAKVNRYIFGYAFDYNFNSIQRHTYGTHEFMIAIKFGDTPGRLRWLNR